MIITATTTTTTTTTGLVAVCDADVALKGGRAFRQARAIAVTWRCLLRIICLRLRSRRPS
ncbi:hypothetical protein T4E_646 [Trichinella pseudospiralis]|uniref:Uncharacterized protein n=1 Tax=Trichinella pseudospiralis TaxID=6337 RepID=A0A0V0Y692_TRIPS|nr:hypothetical protein T4E_646 [Trichinella pseudospiralis]